MAQALVNLVEETCCTEGCGITFWLGKDYHDRLVSTKRSFYCPNGHSMHYLGESDGAKIIRLKNEKAQMEREHASEIARIKRELTPPTAPKKTRKKRTVKKTKS